MNSVHKTVLLNETIDGLNLNAKSVVVDATFGGGGHSVEICRRYQEVKIIAFDQDKSVFEKAKSKFEKLDCDVTFINANFRDIDKVLKEKVDAIIFDLGLSSDQLENSGRGFSFLKDEPLIMQMKNGAEGNLSGEDLTAEDIVNTWSEKSLSDIIYGYGEEKFSRRIAKAIVDTREQREIKTTFELVEVIRNAVPARFAIASARRAVYRRGHAKGRASNLHFATRTFQALRIAVNDELGALSLGLQKGFDALKVPARPHDGSGAGGGGRMAVISFHSLEDRVTKKFFKDKEKHGQVKLINKKPIIAGTEELKSNNRARSAKLRIIEKLK